MMALRPALRSQLLVLSYLSAFEGVCFMSHVPSRAQSQQQESSRADFSVELARVIKQEAGTRLADHGTFFLDYFTEDAVMEFPFDPGGGFSVQGTTAIHELFVKVDRSIRIETYHTDNGATMILEYTSQPRFLKGNVAFPQRYISVVGFRDGRISLFREYINPLKPLQALGKYP